jgi:hypothetical protein
VPLQANQFLFREGTTDVLRVDSARPLRLELFNAHLTEPHFFEPREGELNLRELPSYPLFEVTPGSLWIRRPRTETPPPYDIADVCEVLSVGGGLVRFLSYPCDRSPSRESSMGAFRFMCQAVRLYQSTWRRQDPLLESLAAFRSSTTEEPVYWVTGQNHSLPIQAVFRSLREARAHARLQAELLGVPRREIRVTARAASAGPLRAVVGLALKKRSPAPPKEVPCPVSRFALLDEDLDDEEAGA